MVEVRWELTGGLNEEQMRRIHEDALILIEDMGLRIMHPDIRDIVGQYEGVVSTETLGMLGFFFETAEEYCQHFDWGVERLLQRKLRSKI